MKYRKKGTRVMELGEIKSKLNMSEKIDSLHRRVRKNDIISLYYERLHFNLCEYWDDNLYEFTDDEVNFYHKYINHVRSSVRNVSSCGSCFDIDYYPFQGVKDITKISLCHNKFCDNCQNLLSIQRYKKYGPIIDELSRCFSIAHVVFTVPNVKRDKLNQCLDDMYYHFKFMLRYLQGKAKISDIDFSKYGFEGGIRSLEITKNEKDNTLHPHFHCIFVFDKKFLISSGRKHINKYSFDLEHRKIPHRKGALDKLKNNPRLFTDFEILLQKIWYLRLNGEKVTKSAIDTLPLGYSVICEPTKDTKEVFKYATKGIFKDIEQLTLTDDAFQDFMFLSDALYKRRIIQGFGCFWHCNFSESINQRAEGDNMYKEVVNRLKEMESPIKMVEFLKNVLKEKEEKNVVYISRQNISAILDGGTSE